MTAKHKPPPPVAVLRARRLVALTPYDSEELDGYPEGTEFDLIARTQRSNPQLGTYWKALKLAVDATGLWPDRRELHKALKLELGRVEPLYNMAGKVTGMQVESAAFDAMNHREFCEYMDKAMAVLSDAIGYDALAWLDE